MRTKISVILLILGAILAFLPLSGKYSLHGKPSILLQEAIDLSTFVTPDQVARWVVSDDSTVRIFDLRSAAGFEASAIPGSVNIPYSDFLSTDLESILNTGMRNIFYSDDDLEANYAVVLAKGIGYKGCYAMKGGMNAWHRDVMNSSFSGETITARENALYETRLKAKKMFTEINSMPDSLKVKYRASLEIERKKLDGGCE